MDKNKRSISFEAGVTLFTESNDLSSIQDIQGKGLAGLIKPILNQGKPLTSDYLTVSVVRISSVLMLRIYIVLKNVSIFLNEELMQSSSI